MGKTTNLGLEIGGFAGDGGNEGAFDRNMKKIDDAMAGASGTLPTEGSAAEIQAGTVTELRLWSPKTIHDEIVRQIAAIPAA